jgi:hypothetical protein
MRQLSGCLLCYLVVRYERMRVFENAYKYSIKAETPSVSKNLVTFGSDLQGLSHVNPIQETAGERPCLGRIPELDFLVSKTEDTRLFAKTLGSISVNT